MSLNCPTCGTSLTLSLTAKGTASVPQTGPELAVVADVSSSKDLDLGLKTYNPATGRKRFAYTDADFLAWWEAYPLHKEKAAAWRAWQKVIAAGVSPQMLIAAAAKYAAYCDSNGVELRHRKYPSGWLNDGRWEDEYPEPKADARYQPYDHDEYLRSLEEIQ